MNIKHVYTRYKYATFWRRFFASIIDGIILWGVHWFEDVILYDVPDIVSQVLNVLLVYDVYIYSVVWHAIWGQPIGKQTLGVKVVSHPDEVGISFKQAFLRDSVPIIGITTIILMSFVMPLFENAKNISKALMFLVVALGFTHVMWSFLEIVTMLLNEKRRALHDFIAKTVVIRT